MLVDGESMNCTVKEIEFFKFELNSKVDFEQVCLLIQLSQKTYLRMYVHWKFYPDKEDHLWVVGDLSDDIMMAMFKKIYMRELFCDANPFQYVPGTDQIAYYDTFKWSLTDEYLKPSSEEFFDGNRMLKYTCWTQPEEIHPCITKPREPSSFEL